MPAVIALWCILVGLGREGSKAWQVSLFPIKIVFMFSHCHFSNADEFFFHVICHFIVMLFVASLAAAHVSWESDPEGLEPQSFFLSFFLAQYLSLQRGGRVFLSSKNHNESQLQVYSISSIGNGSSEALHFIVHNFFIKGELCDSG